MSDRSGYIGRAPGDSNVVIARQIFNPTGVTTTFTFASGYDAGYLDAYLNGVRLIKGSDYTASDGATVGFTTYTTSGDVLELVAYKAFNLGSVKEANGNFDVGNDLTVAGNLNVTGDIVYDEVTGRNIYISGLSTFVGVSTFKSDVYIDGDLNVTGDIVYDEVTGRNLNITGVGTISTLGVTGITTVGILTSYSSISVGSTNLLTEIGTKASIGMVLALG